MITEDDILRGVPLEPARPYIIYGAGSLGEKVLARLTRQGALVTAFADRDSLKQTAGVRGLPVLAPAELPARCAAGHRVVIATMYVESAITTLRALGLKSGADFVIPLDVAGRAQGAPAAAEKRAVLFGASALGQKAALALRGEFAVVAFVDNDPRKWGRTWTDLPVHPPEFLKKLTDEQIIITSSFHEAIARQLRELGIHAFTIYGQPSPSAAAKPAPAVPGRREPDILDRIAKLRSDYGETLKLMHGLGCRPNTVIDVGVALGTEELYQAFPDTHLLLVEPLEEFRPHLEKIATTRPNVRFVVAAAGDRDGFVDITVTPDKTTSSLLPLGSQPRRRVPMARVDTLCQRWNAPPPYVIKVDVQGHELTVMDGCSALLEQTLAVVLEVTFLGHSPVIPEFFDVLAYMKQRGFVAYEVLGGHNRPLDFARCQADVVFVQENGPLRSDRRWSTPEQNALFREAKRSRAVFREVMDRG